MKRYGEERLKEGDITYIIGTYKEYKHPFRNIAYIPDLYFYIPLKKGKKLRKGKKLYKSEYTMALYTNTDKTLTLKLVTWIKEYLEMFKPKYINAYPYPDDDLSAYEKRKRVYRKFMWKNGYALCYDDTACGYAGDSLFIFERM